MFGCLCNTCLVDAVDGGQNVCTFTQGTGCEKSLENCRNCVAGSRHVRTCSGYVGGGKVQLEKTLAALRALPATVNGIPMLPIVKTLERLQMALWVAGDVDRRMEIGEGQAAELLQEVLDNLDAIQGPVREMEAGNNAEN